MDEPDVFTMLDRMRRDRRRPLRTILFTGRVIGFVFYDLEAKTVLPARLYEKFSDGVRAEWRRSEKARR